MKVEVDYGDKKYGNSSPARKYKLTIQVIPWDVKEVIIDFDFSEYEWGKNNDSMVKGGKIIMPIHQAAIFASLIMSIIQEAEIHTRDESLEYEFDEMDLLTASTRAITAIELAQRSNVSFDRIVKEAKALNIEISDITHYISIQDAEIIVESINSPNEK